MTLIKQQQNKQLLQSKICVLCNKQKRWIFHLCGVAIHSRALMRTDFRLISGELQLKQKLVFPYSNYNAIRIIDSIGYF